MLLTPQKKKKKKEHADFIKKQTKETSKKYTTVFNLCNNNWCENYHSPLFVCLREQ